jgi:gamma-glutamyltranspeptidase/glutathione hydrolase
VGAWAALSARFGRLPFADLMAPAIEIAERGYAVPVVVQQKWAAATPELQSQPGFAHSFLPWGRAPQFGELFQFKAAARALRLIAQTKGEAFYRGEIAQALETFSRQHGGQLTARDMAAFQPEWVTPIAKNYRGHTVHEIPPSGQGIAALMALGILEHFDVAGLAVDGVDFQHVQIEAMKLAFADVYRYVAEPSAMEVTAEQLLDDAYLASRAKLIDPNRASTPTAGQPHSGGTVYLTAADENGMMISFIQSNYKGFGSGVVVPNTGIALQNRGAGFSLQAGHPNQVAPGKRPFHTIIPGFLTRDGQPLMSFGLMGGSMQAQGHMQVTSRLADFGQNPQAASDAPRWRVMDNNVGVAVEHNCPPDTVEGLKQRGHHVKVAPRMDLEFGSAQMAHVMEHGYLAASDHRKDGYPMGY